MAHAEPAPLPSVPSPVRRFSLWTRAVVLAAIGALLALIFMMGRVLWSEWSRLNAELGRARTTVVIGYRNITPHISFASKPKDWYHDEGSQTLIWSGWKDGVGHQWFRIGRGEVERARITGAFGRDVIQAIDRPLVEENGGTIWGRIPDEALVVTFTHQGVETVYPIQVLDKVEVVNDLIAQHPFLVSYNPFASAGRPVGIYESVLDGQRVTMGLTGYFHDGKPLLYDRGTESLWVPEDDGLAAIAGRHKGASLRRVSQPTPVSWSDWRGQNAKGRLIVGADRSGDKPAL
jgi:hypothetical protein